MHRTLFAKPLQLFAVLPILAANILPSQSLGFVQNGPNVVVSTSAENGSLLQETTDNKQADFEEKAKKIDAYFASIKSPLVGYGKKFVEEAEKNDLPWNLLAGITMIESTAYRNACKNRSGANNGFGWGGCSISFKSIDEAIEVVSFHLGGNHPRTARYYEGKDIDGILKAFNPPKIVPDYSSKVQKVMKRIENFNI